MNERKARKDVLINVLPADEVGVWHCMLELALELDRTAVPAHARRLGYLEYLAPDGRVGRFTPDLMARVFELPVPLVASAVEKLLELHILGYDGDTLFIEDAEDWFVPLTESPRLRN